ncbi:hypothetical protein DPMN_182746 [Dreissena polymorpha]|uniref:Uncharacterized protein n=1 Tax=Dreissena polymorpha TaxID=45954 RepID=A0A9D4DET2_DREPO|nr:hypothetical protein DPMN_182746 [Dreissena polymorpha]
MRDTWSDYCVPPYCGHKKGPYLCQGTGSRDFSACSSRGHTQSLSLLQSAMTPRIAGSAVVAHTNACRTAE